MEHSHHFTIYVKRFTCQYGSAAANYLSIDYLCRADVAGSLVFNTTPKFSHFTISAMAHTPSAQILSPLRIEGPSQTSERFGKALGPELTGILLCISRLAARVDQEPPAEPIHATTDLSRELFTLSHDLLVLPQLEATRACPSTPWTSEQASMREAVRQAALAAVACVLTVSSRDDTYCARRRNGKIRKLICGANDEAWRDMEELRVWVLAVAALIENDEDKTWLAGQIANIMYQRGLYTWDDLVILLRRVAWSEALAVQDTARFKIKMEQALDEILTL